MHITQHDPGANLLSYRRHKKRRGRYLAFIAIDGRRVDLGPHGSDESYEAYDRVVAEWKANRGQTGPRLGGFRVVELLNRFREHAEGYYRGPDGKPSREFGNYSVVAQPIRKLYGRSRVRDSTPPALKAIRQEMVELGWCRRSINTGVGLAGKDQQQAVRIEFRPAAAA